jgi:hypothetical protein
MSRISKFARSPQGKKAVEQAKEFANKPETKEKIEQARQKLSGKDKAQPGNGVEKQPGNGVEKQHGNGVQSPAAETKPPTP